VATQHQPRPACPSGALTAAQRPVRGAARRARARPVCNGGGGSIGSRQSSAGCVSGRRCRVAVPTDGRLL
jgi:hypothetical protein